MIFVFFVWLKKTLRSFGGVLLLTWVFAFWFFSWVFALRFLRGYLRFARFLNVNGRQWPLMVVNVFLACFARYGRQCFLGGLCANAR